MCGTAGNYNAKKQIENDARTHTDVLMIVASGFQGYPEVVHGSAEGDWEIPGSNLW